MMVSANSAIWVPAEPTVAGPKALEKDHHLGVESRPSQARQHAWRRVAGDQQEFEDAGQQHAPRRRVARGRKEGRQRQRHHHRQVEQDRRRRRRRKTVERVEDAAVERDQADQQQIGKRDPGELDREREAARILAEARRQQIDHHRREQATASASSTTWIASSSVKIRSVNSRAGPCPLAPRIARIGRNERGVERAFGEDRAEMVRQPQRDEKRIGHRPGAQHRRQHDVAQEAGHARERA